ncbi:alpha/beta hydrolase [Nocardioides sp. BP30]|uniref:alpha/beta hydrolase n=1 Tax=Nocardioides sp. BP30 TaxID=3036374 RepID=UPI002469A784|nr:alpha/beta hydrolase [Nocardioides sp. BP30]WGL52838.1 alpha/beta hydrolase [Nocardioides sp. BP30]
MSRPHSRRHSRPGSWLGLAGIGVLIAGLLAGCGGSSPSATASPSASSTTSSTASGSSSAAASSGSSVTTAPDPALARFYDQRLAWSSCRSKDQCSSLTVPLDYRHPAGATIKLAVLKVPAADAGERIGSLVVNPGGPGGSGVDYAADAGQSFRAPIRDHYDIVGFDPRGVGRSDPIDCVSDAQLDAIVAEDPAPSTPAEVRSYAQLNQVMADGCAKSPLVAHISTVDAARDIDVLRAALGENKLAYFGASYGTKLGTTYADLFPTRVGRFVLDGAIDPTLDTEQLSVEQAAGFETALRSYVNSCVSASNPCFLGATVDAGLAKIKALLTQVEQKPLPASGGRELKGGNAFYGVAVTLYNRDYWVLLTQALQQAFTGNGSALLQLSDAYASRSGDGSYSDNSMEALYAVDCLDDPSSVPAGKIASILPEFEKASPTFGDVFAWGMTSCADFKERSDDPAPPVGAPGADPIVVIGTTRDPATPLPWAKHLASLLSSGVLVTRDGDGHTGYNTGNSCVDSAVENYLDEGNVPQDNLSC